MEAVLKVLKSGPMMSVQDSGRFGYRARGVSTSGAMDKHAHAIANALVGNAPEAAALEFALMGGTFQATQDVLIAVTGGACRIEIDCQPKSPWESHILKAGETLTIGTLLGATWGYLAISGGLITTPQLGSQSTHLRSGLGGLDGKTITAGTQLQLGSSPRRKPMALPQYYQRGQGPIRVILGPQQDYFDAATIETFLSQQFTVTPSRDRMAMVLTGPELKAHRGHDIVSDATVIGSIQVPSSGKPIVLTADGQTTGGYPKIATIASVDLPRLVQMPSGQRFNFRAIAADHAEELIIKRHRDVCSLISNILVSHR